MIILASNSPRRRQLLTMAGWAYSACPASIDESPFPAEDPQAYVLRLAEEKARTVADSFKYVDTAERFVVAADTTVALDGQILGKPASTAEAQEMLLSLRGCVHQVYTGLAVLRLADQMIQLEVVTSDVYMRNYSDGEMQAYIASGDPFDKAGAYAIQHIGFHPVDHLEGCFANVMGLPLCNLTRLLQAFDQNPDQMPQAACQGLTGQTCTVYAQLFEQRQPAG